MNEPKTEDVMWALERCIQSESCEYCEYHKGIDVCTIKSDALALLREKDAETERLKNEVKSCHKVLGGHNDPVGEKGECGLKPQCRAEAITEFAERLKANLIAGGIYPVFVKNAIEKIAKEMKEEPHDNL